MSAFEVYSKLFSDIKRQRFFMVVLGYIVVLLAYLLAYFPSTVVNVSLILTAGIGCLVASGLFYSILLPQMNVKGILAGYISGMVPIIVTLIGLFHFPRPDDRINRTITDTSQCEMMFQVRKRENQRSLNADCLYSICLF